MIIGKIKLAPGNPAWFDHTSGIYLTIASPVADIKTEMNVSNVKIGLQYGTIKLIEGCVEVPSENVKTVSKVLVQEAVEEISVEETFVEEAPKVKSKKSKKQEA